MAKYRGFPAKCLVNRQLLRRVGNMIITAQNVRDFHHVVIDDNGKMAADPEGAAITGKYAGMTREACRECIVEDLRASGHLVREEDIIHWMNYNDLHFIQCACRFTESCASCGGTEKGSKRAEIKDLIRELRKKNPYIEKNIFRSVENVNLNTVIGYKKDGVRHHFLDEYDKA